MSVMAASVSVKGIVFTLVLFVTAFFGCLGVLVPAFFLIPISLHAYRWYIDRFFGLWLGHVTGLVELVFGVKVKVTGDLRPLSKSKPTLIVMNHRTRFDWLFFWCYMIRLGSCYHLKIILKNSLKSIPGFGWAMQTANYIFLQRSWARDEIYLRKTLGYFTMLDYPLQLLLFPEGTDLSPSNKVKDRKYAEGKGLTVYEYVLHPHTTGFVSCVQNMSLKRKISICNVTIGYVGNIAQNESDILAGKFESRLVKSNNLMSTLLPSCTGNWPSEIHFHVKHVPEDEISEVSEKAQFAEWLNSCWDNKEKLLNQFSKDNVFPGPTFRDTRIVKLKMMTCLLFWFLIVAVYFYCLAAVSYSWLYTVAVIVMYTTVDRLLGGWDSVILRKHEKKPTH